MHALYIGAYFVIGAIVAGLLRRFGLLDDIDEEIGVHAICGIFWPITVAVVALRVTVFALFAFIYYMIGGPRG